MTLPILTCLPGEPWEAALVASLENDNFGVTVVRRCMDLADLLATAASGTARAVLVGSSLRRLTEDMRAQLAACGLVVVGVTAADDDRAGTWLRRRGVRHLLSTESTPRQVAEFLLATVRESTRPSTEAAGSPGDRGSSFGCEEQVGWHPQVEHAFADPRASLPSGLGFPPGAPPPLSAPVLSPEPRIGRASVQGGASAHSGASAQHGASAQGPASAPDPASAQGPASAPDPARARSLSPDGSSGAAPSQVSAPSPVSGPSPGSVPSSGTGRPPGTAPSSGTAARVAAAQAEGPVRRPGTVRGRATAAVSRGRASGEPSGSGRVVAVWGPAGGPGRTTIALGLAWEAAELGVSTVLCDADTYGGSIAIHVGYLDEAPGLAAAARLANNGSLDLPGLATTAPAVGDNLRLLSGVTRAERWTELRPAALATVIRLARQMSDLVVIDCGFCLEQDEELSFDTLAPRRNGATLTCLAAADVVVAVCAADPVGIVRFAHGLAQLRAVVPGVAPIVLMNKVRSGPVGRDAGKQVREALALHASVREAIAIPDDRDGLDAALHQAQPLARVAPASPIRPPLRALARRVAGLPAEVPRRRQILARRT